MSPEDETRKDQPLKDQPSGARPLEHGGVFSSIFTSDEAAAVTSDRAWLQAFLDVELALARALATAGALPAGSVERLAKTLTVEGLDPVEIGRQARASGNPVVPFLSCLRSRLAEEEAACLHRGATSQDVLDSALALVARKAVGLTVTDLARATTAALRLARRHRSTLQLARTLMQPALPSTFGLQAARWSSAIADASDHLAHAVGEMGAELGGAAGTLASFGGDGLGGSSAGLEVRRLFAAELGLPLPDLPRHSDRQAVARLASALAIVCGTCAKVGRDVALLSMPEIGELAEAGGEGRGGSSTLPQKANPVFSILLVANGRRAAGLAAGLLGSLDGELERSAGAWHAEWTAVDDLLRAAAGSARGAADLLEGLQVHPARMEANLQAQPAVFAERLRLELEARAGRPRAQELLAEVAEASRRDGISYRQAVEDLLARHPEAEPLDLVALFDPRGYLGAAEALVDSVVRRQGLPG